MRKHVLISLDADLHDDVRNLIDKYNWNRRVKEKMSFSGVVAEWLVEFSSSMAVEMSGTKSGK